MNGMVSKVGASIATLLLTTSVASAALVEVELDDFLGEWSNVKPTDLVPAPANTGLSNNPEVRWGTPVPATGERSGYRIDLPPADSPAISAPVLQQFDVPGATDFFRVGNFTHYNFPIRVGTSIESVVFTIGFDLGLGDVGGPYADQGRFSFDFQFNHWETNNQVGNTSIVCPNGELNGTGLNLTAAGEAKCADRVSITPLSTSDSFMVDGTRYTFDLVGFSGDDAGDDCGTLCSEFWTIEDQTNHAGLFARIRAVETPEPGSLALLGLGLLGLGMTKRRKQ